ncbi:hypothetical protein IEQ34_000685 [Dendrobium chrysotoxum]|uniref:Uncharacterized protein n=1 Tax=Dendrobium chrysotoxum TaxID=161865 RepID=A0AAV7HR54_DENCH|nr:hypothetical protein IEQ34_000685 [Dendrobium chrysotoxum]
MGRFTSDAQDRSWVSAFFFVKNDWDLIEKWGKMKDLFAPLHVRKENILRILNVPDIEHLLYEDQKVSVEKIAALEAENKRSQTLIAEKEAALFGLKSSRIIEDFKKSEGFGAAVYINEGFIQGFFKAVRLVQPKTGVEVEGLTLSRASDDFPTFSDGDEIESELQKAFALEER